LGIPFLEKNGIVNWLMPREMWSAFPGNMPYVVIKQEVIKEKLEK